ncbi:MAG TPA: glycosyltransferase family A protein [Candidatus Lustribacter sp.]|jgi:hypothetical protein|nr:glycosyltransferase family A protein [Candidatus Lustribacter sp.]
MISAFGPHAERYASGLGDMSAIVAEPDFTPSAYREAVRRRERGEPFYGMLLYDDPRAALAALVAPQILDKIPHHDYRLHAFRDLAKDQLTIDGRTSGQVWSLPPMALTVASDYLRLCDAMLVRSYAEYDRISAAFAVARPVERILAEPHLPNVQPAPQRPGVIVWAPHETLGTVAMLAFGLTEFLGDVTVVWPGGALPHFPAMRSVAPDDPGLAAVLASAGVIVPASLGDPGAAVAFARRGYGVAAPVTSGATEFVPAVAPFDFGSSDSFVQALAQAFGRRAGTPYALQAPPRAPELPAYPVPPAELPLVSIVIPTYNRRDELARVLALLSRQTYPNFEVVVVNDAGEAVDDVVAPHESFARLHVREKNGGVFSTTMVGLELARGAYVQILADDDALYPDHLQRLMAAMLVQNAAAAHSNTLIRYLERDAAGAWGTSGFNACIFTRTTYPTEALISTPISGQGLLVRADVFAEIGKYREDTILADQEFQFRLWNHYPLVWVDHITSEWRVRGASENISTSVNTGPEMERIFNEMHPVVNRPLIVEQRTATLANVKNRPAGTTFVPTISFPPSAS